MSMRDIKPEKRKNMMDEMMPDIERFPHFGIETKHLPEAKDWEIGKIYTVTLKVKMTGISIHERSNGGESGHADFEIKGIDPHEKKRKMNILDNDKK